MAAAAGVICTSGSAAAGIRARHGLDDIRVALPGTAPAPLAAGSLAAGSGVAALHRRGCAAAEQGPGAPA